MNLRGLLQTWQAGTGQENVFASTADRMLSKLGKHDRGKLSPEPCREKGDKPCNIPASQKSPSDILGEKAADWHPTVAEEACDCAAALPVTQPALSGL